jgi:hypothetical protein
MRADQRTGKTREGCAEREDDGVEKADIDAEGGDHFAVGLAGADLHAEPGLRDQQAKPGRDHETGNDDCQPIGRIGQAAGQHDRTGEKSRRVEIERKGAEDEADTFGKHQHQREGRQHLVEVIAVIEPANHHDLDQSAKRRSRHKAGDQADPEGAGPGGDRRADEAPDHEQRAMGEVDQSHDTKDQGQAGRHQEQHDAELQAVEDLLEKKGNGHRLPGSHQCRETNRAGHDRSARQ